MSASEVINWLGLSKTSPGVKVTTLPSSYFKFPPSPEPTTVPPPTNSPSLAHPFTIPTDLYNALLSPNVPITVALVYMSFVTLANSVNVNRKYKPWAFSRTRLFKLLVILHNAFLALFSAWTFVGMVNAMRLSLPIWGEQWKLTDTVDALCKLQGPRGAGNAATYNATSSAWTMTNRLLHLAADGLGPEPTDVGRLWNEGLAFYGWIFYLSKFYEIIDTFIILAKGKKSSLLQTYHHAGAIISMWAGIRYMSSPIWVFVLVNSAVHAIMYTFYLFSTLGIRLPKWLKQSLTSLQIIQFGFGATYAFLHLFIAYQIPVSVPYIYHLGSTASKVLSDVPSEASSTLSSAITTASASVGAWLKKAALRAAGYEGLAENVLNEQGRPFGIDAVHIAEEVLAREETRYRDELQWVHCLDTSGQVFAILLNCLYLVPLICLFVEFFVTAYLKRTERGQHSTASEKASLARRSLQDASKGVSRRLSEAIEEMHRTSEDIGDDAVIVDGDEVKRELEEAFDQAKSAVQQGSEKFKQSIPSVDSEKLKQQVQQGSEKLKQSIPSVDSETLKQQVQQDVEQLRKNLRDTVDKIKAAAANKVDEEHKESVIATARSVKNTTTEVVEQAVENVKSVTETVKRGATNLTSEETKQNVRSTADKAAVKAGDIKNDAVAATKRTTDQVSETVKGATANLTSEETKQQVKSSTNKVATKAADAKDGAVASAKRATDQAPESAPETSKSGKETAEKQVEKSKPKGKKSEKTPNGNGTSAAEASGQPQPKGKAGTTKAENGEGVKQEKKKEDRIIDESQAVRDHDLDASGDGGDKAHEEAKSSEVKPGTSFADAVKEDEPQSSEVKPGVSFADAIKE
ncbi:hypothetical protein A1O3_01198 [Capronia epimyces CBS 606.96]|uniref:Elongation of fatty acids protein n=1 Tax=Capronia epimyces CBS 606.96 TaxID=1182542 RepID=W9YTQ9_9EURO|nr:uncharacterized protein A1O3_01198 [Capronia epimyces CBS 606.96]EXJ92646.1 hypothetical protein A1O3_01198 [Capronia epimyces CBS 606.96]